MKKSEILESIPCPLCNNEKLQLISKKGQFGLPCNVSICPKDGLVFLCPRWSKERYNTFYQNEYDSYYRPAILSNESEEEKYRNIKIISARLEKHNLLQKRESVLDIGAGMGWSLNWLKLNYSHFNTFAAIESSKNCIANLTNVIGASVISDDIDANWESSGFNLVIMRHVFEHVLKPVETLKKIHENLSSNGIIYIAVPDMMNPKGSLKNYWFRSVHTFYYSEATLVSIAAKANLEPIEIKSENSELWGIFKKSQENKKNPILDNVYNKQISIINTHQKKAIIIDLKQKIIRVILSLLPKDIKSWLLNKYNK